MQCKKYIPVLITLLLLVTSCIKQVKVQTRNAPPILVVEGGITTDTVPYTVKLSYSGTLRAANDIPVEQLEENARVTIADDEGNATALAYRDSGIYQTTDPDYIGRVGRSYHVIIELKDGRKFISAPEKVNPAVSFNNLSVHFVQDFNLDYPAYMTMTIDTKDPAEQENYYKWDLYSWTPRKTKGVPCGFGCILYEYCFQKIVDPGVRILADAVINGNEINNNQVGKSYIYWYGKHYIDVGQSSISREYYQFLERYQEQLTRTGSILDPLPASIKGNVFNAVDSGDFALGYFSASAVTHKRAILVPFNITQYLLDISAVNFIPDRSVACFEYFANSLVYDAPPAEQNPAPPGWENAERIEVHW